MFCQRDFVDSANMRKHKVKDHPNELAAYENEFGKGNRQRDTAEEREMFLEDEETMDGED